MSLENLWAFLVPSKLSPPAYARDVLVRPRTEHEPDWTNCCFGSCHARCGIPNRFADDLLQAGLILQCGRLLQDFSACAAPTLSCLAGLRNRTPRVLLAGAHLLRPVLPDFGGRDGESAGGGAISIDENAWASQASMTTDNLAPL